MQSINRQHGTRNSGNRRGGAPRLVVVGAPQRLDEAMKQQRVMCRQLSRHPVPIMMKFIAEATSHSGQPMAVYACTFPGCDCRQGWVRDRRTGKPIQLWSGVHKK